MLPDKPDSVGLSLLVTTGSYCSNSLGHEIFGASILLKFPEPEIVILQTTASFTETVSFGLLKLILNLPTAPEKPIGSDGNELTFNEIAEDFADTGALS